MHKILIVAHEYPPINSAGAERILKFARYLPDFGYRPIVLTTDRYGSLESDTANRVYRAADLIHSAFGFLRRRRDVEVAQATQFRVATIANQSPAGRARDAIMIPDTKLGWLLPAAALGRRLIAEYRPELIFSSSPPETAHLVAGRLSRVSGLPWVADLRDGWLFEPPNPATRRGALRCRLEARLERNMVMHARALVTATAPIAEDLRLRYGLGIEQTRIVANGYDRAEYVGLARQRQPDGTFLLAYTGSLSSSRQGTSPDSFFIAVANLLRINPTIPLRVRVIGETRPEEKAAAAALGLTDHVTFLPPVSRREAHQHQLDADALLLITAPGQRSVATLKLFDYIGSGVPILALAHDNVAAEIVESYGLGITAASDDPTMIAAALGNLVAEQGAGVTWPGFAAAQARFERRALTGELAALFDRILDADQRR